MYLTSNNEFVDNSYISCNECNKITNINYDSSKNIYNFSYNNKNIKLSDEYYMDHNGNIDYLERRCEKLKNTPQWNYISEYKKKNNLITLNKLEQNLQKQRKNDSNNYQYNSISESNNDNISNSQAIISDKLSDKIASILSDNLSNIFTKQINNLLNPKMNVGNVGSNLNSSPHSYMNLNSSTLNLADANSNHNLINDNPFSGQQPCYDKKTGNTISCPELYYYKPPMY